MGLKRIARVCTESEEEHNAYPWKKSEEKPWRDGSICLEHCTFAWNSTKTSGPQSVDIALWDVSLQVEPGSLVGVVGFVGSGKSALLSSIQGETHRTSGYCSIAGETLSGGQKQRISLARAVYSDSSVYLLDDPLSGLDVQVAAKVFKRVIGNNGLLRDKVNSIMTIES
ncbi:hypothetical protein MTO96_043279 [Rhipicephalus appendiculatus]